MDYDERSCPFCRETIKRSAFFCDMCGKDLSRQPPEFGLGPFQKEEKEHYTVRIAKKAADRSRFTAYVSMFTTLIIIGAMIWIGVVPFLVKIKNPAPMGVPVLIVVAVPLLLIAIAFISFAMPANLGSRGGRPGKFGFSTWLGYGSIAAVIYAFNAPYSICQYVMPIAFICALVALPFGNRIASLTAVVMCLVGFAAIHELKPAATGESQSLVKKLEGWHYRSR